MLGEMRVPEGLQPAEGALSFANNRLRGLEHASGKIRVVILSCFGLRDGLLALVD
jgi:hypothetical protein